MSDMPDKLDRRRCNFRLASSPLFMVMTKRMTRSLRLFLSVCIGILTAVAAHAQTGGYSGFKTSADSLAVQSLVRVYLKYSQADPIPPDSIKYIATDELEKMLTKSNGVPPRFPKSMRWAFESTRAIRADGRRAVAVLSVAADSVPMFGPFVIDWVFFAQRSEEGVWRLNALRRQTGVEDGVAELRFLDTSSVYPPSLKPIVARESGRLLLSNTQLRAMFSENRAAFASLAGHFNHRDSLHMLARIDRVPTQINRYAISWGEAAQEIPQQAVDEYLAKASKEEQETMRASIRATEVIRRRGRDTVVKICRRLGIAPTRLDSVVALMHDLRVTFVNAELPWKNAVQFTVGGRQDDVLGYLYSPSGEVPLISTEEYFYLEDLGNGWWIFRAT